MWFIFALLSAVFWGADYVICEKLLKEGVGPAFIMLMTTLISLPFYLGLSYFSGQLKTGLSQMTVSFDLLFLIIIMSLMSVAANLFILLGVQEKNATLVSLIEISYPVFVLLFAWWFFNDFQLNASNAFGALLIFTGIGLVIWKS